MTALRLRALEVFCVILSIKAQKLCTSLERPISLAPGITQLVPGLGYWLVLCIDSVKSSEMGMADLL